MSQKQLLLIILGLLVAAVAGSMFYATQTLKHQQATQITTDGDEGDAVGQNVTFTVTEGEHKKWELHVKRAIYFEDHAGADLEGVEGDFFNDAGKAVVHFTAPAGKYLNETKAVTLKGGVIAESTEEDGGKVLAPTMTWSTRSKVVQAQGGVNLTMGDTATSKADQCEFALDFSSIDLRGHVESNIDM